MKDHIVAVHVQMEGHMDTRVLAREYRFSHWVQIMQERTQSGLSIAEYCRRTGLSQSTYYYWRRELSNAVDEQAGATPAEMKPFSFTEVQVITPQDNALAQQKSESPGALHIVVNGIGITVDQVYPVAQLVELLKGLV